MTNEEVTPLDLARFLRSLRAVRRYSPTPVLDDVIASILEVGRWTGSAKNTQPWEIMVIKDRATLRRISTLGHFAGHLSGAAFALALIMESAANDLDAGRLAERLMLGAWAHGVGSCIGSLFPSENESRAKVLLGIPSERSLHTTIAFGYPADATALRIQTTPGVRSVLPSIGRRPLEEIVHVDHYGRHWEPGT